MITEEKQRLLRELTIGYVISAAITGVFTLILPVVLSLLV